MSDPTREELIEIGAKALAEDRDEMWSRLEKIRKDDHRADATAILDAILPPLSSPDKGEGL